MSQRHILPDREQVFIKSLVYHGFRWTRVRKNLKYKYGYIIPSTKFEDHSGIDFWIKMPKDEILYPIQITQRGIRILKKYQGSSIPKLSELISESQIRIKNKRRRCKKHKIAFVLVSDYTGTNTNSRIAWCDKKALHFAIANLKRWI